MNKPKKKENVSWQMSGGFDRGYNQACDDWEKFYIDKAIDFMAEIDSLRLSEEEVLKVIEHAVEFGELVFKPKEVAKAICELQRGRDPSTT